MQFITLVSHGVAESMNPFRNLYINQNKKATVIHANRDKSALSFNFHTNLKKFMSFFILLGDGYEL